MIQAPIWKSADGGSLTTHGGIIEVPNRLSSSRTAVIVVHPWGIDDGQGLAQPRAGRRRVSMHPGEEQDRARACRQGHRSRFSRPCAVKLAYSWAIAFRELRIRSGGRSTARSAASPQSRNAGKASESSRPSSKASITAGSQYPVRSTVDSQTPALAYFKQFPGLDAGPAFDGTRILELPIPVMKPIEVGFAGLGRL